MLSSSTIPPVDKYSTLQRILHDGMFSAALLLACAVFSFWAANTSLVVFGAPLYEHVHHFWETHLSIGLGSWQVDLALHHWVNDGLMAIFFFLVGMEIKRELLIGELASFRKALLPAIAAAGGMIVPAGIYALVNLGGPGIGGWGIPMATDIAFAAGVLGILGGRIHPNLAVFLVALAIVDDLGAVLVIAIFYTDTIELYPLAIGLGLIGISAALSLLRVRSAVPYVLIAAIVWFAFLKSGIHATIEGVLLAFTIPVNARYDTPLFIVRVRGLLERFREAEDFSAPRLVNARQQRIVRAIETECIHVEAPLQRIENKLHPWCALFIMPVFALANAGVHVDFSQGWGLLAQPITAGAALGLLLGKPLGIFLASFLAVKIGIAALPDGLCWNKLLGLGFLGGIGFTMSLFVAQLAFGSTSEAHLVEAKAGVLAASVLAAVIGSLLLLWATRNETPAPRESH